MARKKAPTLNMVAYHWLDAAGSDEQDAHVSPIHALRSGFVIEEHEDHVVVASEIFEDGSSRDKIAIPWVLVKGVISRKVRLPKEFAGWESIQK